MSAVIFVIYCVRIKRKNFVVDFTIFHPTMRIVPVRVLLTSSFAPTSKETVPYTLHGSAFVSSHNLYILSNVKDKKKSRHQCLLWIYRFLVKMLQNPFHVKLGFQITRKLLLFQPSSFNTIFENIIPVLCRWLGCLEKMNNHLPQIVLTHCELVWSRMIFFLFFALYDSIYDRDILSLMLLLISVLCLGRAILNSSKN